MKKWNKIQVLCKKGRGAIRVLQAKTFGEAEKCTKFEKFVYILSVHVGTTCVVHFKLYSLYFQKVLSKVNDFLITAQHNTPHRFVRT